MFPKRLIACVSACVALGCLMSAAAPIDGTFNYQGRLTNSGAAVTGTADLKFRLYDDSAAGAQVGSEIELLGVPVSGGYFNVDLDFGVTSFNGDQRWLEIDARSPAGAGGYTTLSPRQQIIGTPYSIQTRGLFVDDAENVGIGTSTPLYPLHVESDGGRAIFGHATASSGITYGGRFENDSTTGRGVYAWASTPTGTTYGGKFESDSTSGTGAYGKATASTGTTYGVYGISQSSSGLGVYGEATASTGTTSGVYGESQSTSGRGVYGHATANSGSTRGGVFRSDSTAGRGVFGEATSSLGFTSGVYGSSASTSGYAVYGLATASTGTTYGGYLESRSTSGRGVYGEATATSGITFGGEFRNASTSARGVLGYATANSGVTYGVWGLTSSQTGRGIFGEANSSTGINYGVFGHSRSPNGFDFFAGGAGTNYGSSSSRRWKHNVEPISDPLDKLAMLQGVYFDWDKDHGGHHDVGMIAEEVGEVMPEIVNYEANGIDAIGMDYSKMTPLLVEAVKELDTKLATLLAENEELRTRVEALERMTMRPAFNTANEAR